MSEQTGPSLLGQTREVAATSQRKTTFRPDLSDHGRYQNRKFSDLYEKRVQEPQEPPTQGPRTK